MIAAFVVPQEKPKKKYIDLDVAINAVYEAYANGESAYDALESIPPADVRPVVRGKWVETKTGFHCSACKSKAKGTKDGALLSNFCPNCGADMREES